jgi:nitrile hydratase accessory protein
MTSSGLPVTSTATREAIIASPQLPHGSDGPVFRAPWEAQAFALAVALHERGEFTWPEWTRALAAVIGEVRQRGEPDMGDQYYRHWLTALERITSAKRLVTLGALSRRKREWEEAARRTPHGQPIELAPRTASVHGTDH